MIALTSAGMQFRSSVSCAFKLLQRFDIAASRSFSNAESDALYDVVRPSESFRIEPVLKCAKGASAISNEFVTCKYTDGFNLAWWVTAKESDLVP